MGGIAGDEAGDKFGGVAEGVGMAAGSLAGMRAADAASGLPATMLVGVTATTVYGFAGRSRRAKPTDLAFQVPRAGLTAKVPRRVNVRVLELIDDASGLPPDFRDALVAIDVAASPTGRPPRRCARAMARSPAACSGLAARSRRHFLLAGSDREQSRSERLAKRQPTNIARATDFWLN
jgi:hypothetical protein